MNKSEIKEIILGYMNADLPEENIDGFGFAVWTACSGEGESNSVLISGLCGWMPPEVVGTVLARAVREFSGAYNKAEETKQ